MISETISKAAKRYFQSNISRCLKAGSGKKILPVSLPIFSLLQWLSFFKDIIALLSYGVKGSEMYLRILLAIDEEVVARHIQPSGMVRN